MKSAATLLATLTALVVVSTARSGGFPRFGTDCARADFSSQGRTVRAAFCKAHGGSGGAVVVLHGCGGFSTFDHRIVTGLPAYGIATYDVDYFGLTPPPGDKGFCNGGRAGVDSFGIWTRVALDAVPRCVTCQVFNTSGSSAGRWVAASLSVRPRQRRSPGDSRRSWASQRGRSAHSRSPPSCHPRFSYPAATPMRYLFR